MADNKGAIADETLEELVNSLHNQQDQLDDLRRDFETLKRQRQEDLEVHQKQRQEDLEVHQKQRQEDLEVHQKQRQEDLEKLKDLEEQIKQVRNTYAEQINGAFENAISISGCTFATTDMMRRVWLQSLPRILSQTLVSC